MISTIISLLLFSAACFAQTGTSPCATLPSSIPMPTVSKLPNPFVFLNGTQVTTKAQWACRREEIRALVQKFELGPMPPKPSSVTGSLSGGTLTVKVTDNGKSISFTASIKTPTSAKPASGYPAIIAYGGGSIPIPSNVATISYNNFDVGADLDRGKGKFYDLYGSGNGAGAMVAWAWGTSRIIDALESLSAANIDTSKIGITGCSRNGKGALVGGFFDDRIALTIPQEGGSGADGCWRIADDLAHTPNGPKVENAAQIVQGDAWFSPIFSNYVNTIPTLPYDHHSLSAVLAPRGLFIVENSGIDYLAPLSSFGCSTAARIVYKALGAEGNLGFTQSNHGHCAFPSSEQGVLNTYINRFLLGQTGTADTFQTSGGTFTWVAGKWIDWVAPTLS